MEWIIVAYLAVTTWVYFMKYEDTPDDKKQKVKDHWFTYWAKCLLWPKLLADRSKGF